MNAEAHRESSTSVRAEGTFQDRRVLVVENDRLSRRLTARAVTATGASVTAVAGQEEGLACLRRLDLDALFTDWDNVGLIPQANALQPQIDTVLMTDQSLFDRDSRAMLDPELPSLGVTNILARSQNHGPMAMREIVTTTAKLLSGDIFGLEKYLSWGATIHQERLTHSDQRQELLLRICEFALQCGLRTTALNRLRVLAEELLMNAIWDAPVDEDGTLAYASRPRSQPVALRPQEAVTIRYGTDGSLLGLSVIDAFGRLEYDTAYRYLVRCFAKGDDQVIEGDCGAGLGLYLAYNTVSSFVINVHPGHRTEVIGLLNLHHMDPRLAYPRSRSFCYFRVPPGYPSLRLERNLGSWDSSK